MSIEQNGGELGRHDIRNTVDGATKSKNKRKIDANCVEKPSQANRLSLQI